MALKNNNEEWVYTEEALQSLVNSFYSSLYATYTNDFVQFNTNCSFSVILHADMDDLRKDISFEETKCSI